MLRDATQRDNTRNPSHRHSGPPQEADAGAIHVFELLWTPTMSVEMLRARSREWFHRLLEENIGVRRRLEPESKADHRSDR